MKIIAKILSSLFTPLLMGTYGLFIALFLSFLSLTPLEARLLVLAVTFVSTTILPLIFIFVLMRLGRVTDSALNVRDERLFPYLFSSLCYCGVGIYYHSIHAPVWMVLFMISGAVILLVLALINHWWKISGHATGMGALTALVLFLQVSGNSPYSLVWLFVAVVLLSGFVGTSRLLLQRHTLAQVGAGYLLGFLFMFLPAWLLLVY